MDLVKDTPFETAWLVWMARPKTPCLTVVVKGTFSIVESGECPIDPEQVLPTGDIHHDEDTERSVRYESDFAFLKPHGECFLAGSCFSPDGQPKETVLAALRIGTVEKTMAIFGDRHFKGLFGGQTKPEPFTEMPLCWERSYGGRKIRENPVGLGRDKSPINGKALVRLPNIENPQNLVISKKHNPGSHGAFPIPRNWTARLKQAGTYDGRWQRARWPWFPEDFQWTFFNAAPEDQQIKGFWRGDEEITLIGLHREQGKVTCKLPGLEAKAFLREATTGELKALTPELDTITIDTDADKVLCIWRAVIEVPSMTLEDYSHLFVVHTKREEDHQHEEYTCWFDRLQAEAAAEEEAYQAEPEPECEEPVHAERFTPPLPEAPPGERTKRRSSVGVRGDLSDAPYLYRPGSSMKLSPLPDPVPLDSPILIPEMSVDEWEALHDRDYEIEDDELETRHEEQGWTLPLQQMVEYSRFQFDPPEAPVAPTDSDESMLLLLGRLAATIEESGDIEGEETALMPPLSKVDLESEDDATDMMSVEDLAAVLGDTQSAHTPAPPAHAEPPALVGAATHRRSGPGDEEPVEPPKWAGSVTEEESPSAKISQASIEGVEFEKKGLEPTQEDRERAEQRERVLSALKSGEGCSEWDLEGANLAGCDLSGADFTRAYLADANLVGCKLDGAKLSGAVLLRADLSGANLKGTDLSDAGLQEAQFKVAFFEEAHLERALASDAVFHGATFTRCECAGLDLGGSDLTGAQFEASVLDSADLTEARLDDAIFTGSSLVEAELGGVTAERVKIERCELERLRASEGANFTDATFAYSKSVGGRFMTSKLVGANLSFAVLDGADFSGANLARATLLGCKLREARFDGASLVSATMGKSDLFQARFEGANLLQADLRGCNLFNAELHGADTRGAKLELANLKGTMLA